MRVRFSGLGDLTGRLVNIDEPKLGVFGVFGRVRNLGDLVDDLIAVWAQLRISNSSQPEQVLQFHWVCIFGHNWLNQ